MKVNLDRNYEYIPEWNGNRDDADPCKFHIRRLTSPEREQCIKTELLVQDGDATAKITTDKERLVRLAVTKIENLTVGDSDIKTVKDFLATQGVDGLFEEIASHIITADSKPELKN